EVEVLHDEREVDAAAGRGVRLDLDRRAAHHHGVVDGPRRRVDHDADAAADLEHAQILGGAAGEHGGHAVAVDHQRALAADQARVRVAGAGEGRALGDGGVREPDL